MWVTVRNLALEKLHATGCLGVLKVGGPVLFQGRARLAPALPAPRQAKNDVGLDQELELNVLITEQLITDWTEQTTQPLRSPDYESAGIPRLIGRR
jgi:hypothetical protein